MKRFSVEGIQKRELNRGLKMPFAIQPGFEGQQPCSCQYVEDSENFLLCNKKVVGTSAYCQFHYQLCYAKNEAGHDEDSVDQFRAAKKDFSAQGGQEGLELAIEDLLLP